MLLHPLTDGDFLVVQRKECAGTSNGIVIIPNSRAKLIMDLFKDGEMDRLSEATVEHYKKWIEDEGMCDWLIHSMKDYIANLINEKIIIYY